MRGVLRRGLGATCLAGLLAAGCYKTPKPECAFLCGDDSACPDDYRCAPDGWCKRVDLAPEHVCEPGQPDASTADARALDAAAPDAAPPDAME